MSKYETKISKRIFFTKLNLRKLEDKLAQMEKAGYRLTSVGGLYRFEFTKSKRKDTKYFCTYDQPRGIRSPDFDITQELVRNYQAERVRDSLSVGAAGLTEVYRTVQANSDLSEMSLARDKYISKIYFSELLLFLMLFALTVVGVVCSAGVERTIFLIFAIVLALPVLWCLIAVIKMKKRTTNQSK